MRVGLPKPLPAAGDPIRVSVEDGPDVWLLAEAYRDPVTARLWLIYVDGRQRAARMHVHGGGPVDMGSAEFKRVNVRAGLYLWRPAPHQPPRGPFRWLQPIPVTRPGADRTGG